VIQALSSYYRVPDCLLGRIWSPTPTGGSGFFKFGPNALCFGQSASGVAKRVQDAGRYDALPYAVVDGADVHLTFDPNEIIEGLRREKYVAALTSEGKELISEGWKYKTYYFVRGMLPVSVRRILQRAYFSDWKTRPFPAWPVDFTVDNLHAQLLRLLAKASGAVRVPFIWYWPDGAPSCLILTHDVETSAGRDFTPQLMDLDSSYDFKASYQVVPEKRYDVPDEYVQSIQDRGLEFNIHDLNHDGRLYLERKEFLRRAKKINHYVRRYGASGFRAGSMYRRIDWYDDFEFSYDMSVPNIAHLEPQRGGCCTVFPFFLGKILEIPLTTGQDYAVFHILNEYSIELWKQQSDLIRQRNGLMSFLTHPDYLIARGARKTYESLLGYLREMIDREKVWMALPGEVANWWRTRSQLQLVQKGVDWEIQGDGKERARIAYAVCEGDRLTYELARAPVHEGSRR
jgi:hypothetical protein